MSLKQFTTAHSTGTVINPLMHQGQIDGGVVMGTGYALMEGMTIEAGKVVTTHFGENKIPTIRDIPSLKTAVLEEPVGNERFGEGAGGNHRHQRTEVRGRKSKRGWPEQGSKRQKQGAEAEELADELRLVARLDN